MTVEDILIPSHCPILGTPLDFSDGTATEPSIDRIDPKSGYVRGNVWIISALANSMKWNATEAQLLQFSRYWVDRLDNYGQGQKWQGHENDSPRYVPPAGDGIEAARGTVSL